MAYTTSSSLSSSSLDSDVSTCSKECLKAYATLKEQYYSLTLDYKKSQHNLFSYKADLQSVEEILVHYKKNEAVFTEKINVLNLEVKLRDKVLAEYTTNLEKVEKVEKERDELKLTLEKLQNSSKSLNTLLDSKVSDKSKAGVGYKELIPKSFVNSSELLEKQDNRSDKGYHEVPPPLTGNYMPLKCDLRLIDEHFESESVDVSDVSSSDVKTVKTVDHKGMVSTEKPKSVMKNDFGPLIIKDWHSDDDSKDELSPTVEVNTAKGKVVVNVVKGNRFNTVKASACWEWRLKKYVLDHVSKHNNAPMILASPAIVEPLRIEFPFLDDQFQEDPPPEVLMADNRTMTELLQAPTEGYEDAIIIPEITERFNDLLRACSHHGFFEFHQLDTFYNALNVNDQDSLNSAAGGNFLDKMPRECLKIIESKSKVCQSRAKAVVAKVSMSSSTLAISSDVAELKDMVKALLLDKKNHSSAPTLSSTPAPVKAIEPNYVTCGATANYNQGNTSFRPQMVANQIRPPGFPPHQNNQNNFNGGNNFNQNRALIKNKEKLNEMARTTMNEHCSAVILNKLPRKLGDPDKFLIPCEFLGMDECLALADLGASINLMPLSVWEGLLLPKLTPICMTLELVDRSVSKPISIAKNISFKVKVFHFPADFVVVNFEPDPRVPLILKRCFLKTSRALIDVHKGELTLRIGNEAITYNLDQTVRYSANYNQMTTNKIDVFESTCEEYSQGVLGFSNVTASGTPTPHNDLIVFATSPTLTPFGDSDFLLFEEADAFLGLEDDPDSSKINPFYYDPEGGILLLEAILNSEPSPPLPNQE
nr:reverse transcriptase domain-containing protein [Tanacetum cinerariifolium]